jgi:hypothetical protein
MTATGAFAHDLFAREGPPGDEAKADRLEILGARAIEVGDGCGRPFAGHESSRESVERRQLGERDRCDAGNSPQLGNGTRPEGVDGAAMIIDGVIASRRYGVEAGGVEAHVDARHLESRAHEQRRHHDEENGDGGLRHDERGSQKPRRESGLVRAFSLEWCDQIGAATMPRGRQARADAGDERHDPEEQVDVEVRREVGAGRGLNHRADEGDGPVREHQADGCGDRPQREALGDQLPEDSPAARAERRTDAHLAIPGDGGRNEDCGRVRASEQQDERDHSEHEDRDRERV